MTWGKQYFMCNRTFNWKKWITIDFWHPLSQIFINLQSFVPKIKSLFTVWEQHICTANATMKKKLHKVCKNQSKNSLASKCKHIQYAYRNYKNQNLKLECMGPANSYKTSKWSSVPASECLGRLTETSTAKKCMLQQLELPNFDPCENWASSSFHFDSSLLRKHE